MTQEPNSTSGSADSASSAPSESAPIELVSPPPAADPVSELTTQLQEMRDRHLRLQAEFENFRKRKMREAEEARAYAAINVLEDLLPVLDHLELALDTTHDRTDPNWGTGIDLIARLFADALKTYGLEEIVVARGDKFEHATQEAVAEADDPEVEPGCVIRVVRKGFRIRERLLRAAHVIVAREVANPLPTGNPSQTGNPSPTGN